MKNVIEKSVKGLLALAFTFIIATSVVIPANAAGYNDNTPKVSDPAQVTAQPGLATGIEATGAAVAKTEAHDGVVIAVPTEAFVLALKNTFGVSITNNAGASKTLRLPAEYNGKKLFIYLYSEPNFIASGTVADGELSFEAPGYSGNHTVAAFDDAGNLVAKAAVNLGGEAKIAKTSGATLPFAIFALVSLSALSAGVFAAKKN